MPDPHIGVRSTRQRTAVVDLLERTEGFSSAQDLHARLREQGQTIGLTTVYRTLQSLADVGAVDTIRTDTGEQLFRQCSPTHHHHLVCRECGYTVEVEGPAVEDWARATGATHGFGELAHTVELFGRCAACAAAGRG